MHAGDILAEGHEEYVFWVPIERCDDAGAGRVVIAGRSLSHHPSGACRAAEFLCYYYLYSDSRVQMYGLRSIECPVNLLVNTSHSEIDKCGIEKNHS